MRRLRPALALAVLVVASGAAVAASLDSVAPAVTAPAPKPFGGLPSGVT